MIRLSFKGWLLNFARYIEYQEVECHCLEEVVEHLTLEAETYDFDRMEVYLATNDPRHVKALTNIEDLHDQLSQDLLVDKIRVNEYLDSRPVQVTAGLIIKRLKKEKADHPAVTKGQGPAVITGLSYAPFDDLWLETPMPERAKRFSKEELLTPVSIDGMDCVFKPVKSELKETEEKPPVDIMAITKRFLR